MSKNIVCRSTRLFLAVAPQIHTPMSAAASAHHAWQIASRTVLVSSRTFIARRMYPTVVNLSSSREVPDEVCARILGCLGNSAPHLRSSSNLPFSAGEGTRVLEACSRHLLHPYSLVPGTPSIGLMVFAQEGRIPWLTGAFMTRGALKAPNLSCGAPSKF